MKFLCSCGREGRYSHIIEGKEVMSCNKYRVCERSPTDTRLTMARIIRRSRQGGDVKITGRMVVGTGNGTI